MSSLSILQFFFDDLIKADTKFVFLYTVCVDIRNVFVKYPSVNNEKNRY